MRSRRERTARRSHSRANWLCARAYESGTGSRTGDRLAPIYIISVGRGAEDEGCGTAGVDDKTRLESKIKGKRAALESGRWTAWGWAMGAVVTSIARAEMRD